MRQASIQTPTGLRGRRRLSNRGGIPLVAVVAAGALGAWLGYSSGTKWAGAAADIADSATRGTGSLGWMDQLGAVAVTWLAVALLSLLAGILVGAATPLLRRTGLVVLIVVMTIVPLISFGAATGLGGDLGFPEGSVATAFFASALAATLGGFIGYGVGRKVRGGRL